MACLVKLWHIMSQTVWDRPREVVAIYLLYSLHCETNGNVTNAIMWPIKGHWQLTLSPTKCSILHVSSGTKLGANTNHTYHLGSTNLPTVDSITDLGVTYDSRLSFSLHIDKIVTKASLRAGIASSLVIHTCLLMHFVHLLDRFSNTVVLYGIPGISMK